METDGPVRNHECGTTSSNGVCEFNTGVEHWTMHMYGSAYDTQKTEIESFGLIRLWLKWFVCVCEAGGLIQSQMFR